MLEERTETKPKSFQCFDAVDWVTELVGANDPKGSPLEHVKEKNKKETGCLTQIFFCKMAACVKVLKCVINYC